MKTSFLVKFFFFFKKSFYVIFFRLPENNSNRELIKMTPKTSLLLATPIECNGLVIKYSAGCWLIPWCNLLVSIDDIDTEGAQLDININKTKTLNFQLKNLSPYQKHKLMKLFPKKTLTTAIKLNSKINLKLSQGCRVTK